MRLTISFSFVVVSMVTSFAVAPAFAQPRPTTDSSTRTSRGLFGTSRPESEPVLTVTGSVSTGYDTNPQLSGEQQIAFNGLLPSTGSIFTMLQGGLAFQKVGEQAEFDAGISSAGRYYPQLGQAFHSSHAASVGGSLAFGERTRVIGSQGASYQSARSFVPFVAVGEPVPGQAIAPDLNFIADGGEYTSFSTTIGLTHQLTRQTSLEASYLLTTSDYAGTASEFRTQTVNFRITRSLARGLGIRLGYGLTDTQYTVGDDDYRNHNIDTGLDFSRALSLTRRTQLGFSTGATALRENGRMRYDVIGTATLTHEMARTWTASVAYNRNVGYNDAIRGPYFYDGLSGNVGGLISRRVGVSADAGVTLGRVTTSAENIRGDFETWYATSGIRFALTRNLAVGADYTFYQYDFARALLLSDGFAPHMRRHSARVLLDIWAPLIETRRRSDATR